MNTKTTIIVVLAIVLTGAASYFIRKMDEQKVVFVRSHDMIYAYEGTREATAKFDEQKAEWQANIDTLSADFQLLVEQYRTGRNELNKTERLKTEKLLNDKQIQLNEYVKAIEEKTQEEDQRMMQEVLNQVNSFSKEYGKSHGYSLIVGTTLSGNVLYGDDQIDITDDFLETLNKHYRGE